MIERIGVLAGVDWTGPAEPPPGRVTAGVETGIEIGVDWPPTIGVVTGID